MTIAVHPAPNAAKFGGATPGLPARFAAAAHDPRASLDLPGTAIEEVFRQVLAETLPAEDPQPAPRIGAVPEKKTRAKAPDSPEPEPKLATAVVVPAPQTPPLPPIHLPFIFAVPVSGETEIPKNKETPVNRPAQDPQSAGQAAPTKHDFETAAPRTPELAFAARLTPPRSEPASTPVNPPSAAARPAASNSPAVQPHEKAAPTALADAEPPVITVIHSAPPPVESTPRTPSAGTVSISKNIATALAAESPTTLESARTEPLRDIALRLTDQNQERVEVRLSDRGGDLRVAVHAADAQLTRDLRDGLGDLVNRLERSGFQTETWKSASTVNAASESDQARDSQQFSDGRDREGGNRQPRREADEQSQSRQRKPQWLEEMNRRFED